MNSRRDLALCQLVIVGFVIAATAFSATRVLAQSLDALSTASASSDTKVEVANPSVPEATSTADGLPSAPVAAETSSSTPQTVAQVPLQTTSVATIEASASPSTTMTADEVAALEDSYRQTHGKYLQILPGNVLPTYEVGTVAGRLGMNIPDNMRVDVYETPSGIGYQISYVASGVAHSKGAGPEGSARSYTIELPRAAASATSTGAF